MNLFYFLSFLFFLFNFFVTQWLLLGIFLLLWSIPVILFFLVSGVLMSCPSSRYLGKLFLSSVAQEIVFDIGFHILHTVLKIQEV